MKMDTDSENLSEDDAQVTSENEEVPPEEEASNPSGKRPLITGDHSESKRAKMRKPLTTEELNYLKETETLYNSSLFRLQIEELLSQINFKEKRVSQMKAWWGELQAFVRSIKPKEDVDFAQLELVRDHPKFIKNLIERKLNFVTDENVTLRFPAPQSAELFGAYALNVSTKTDSHLDVCIRMPASCFREKDYLNNRYFIKRNFYTVYIFGELSEAALGENVEFLYRGGHKLLPFIRLTPSFGDTIKIDVHIAGPERLFKLHRLRPDKNNIKIDLFDEFYDVSAPEFEGHGTPLYNSLMARDFTLSLNQSHMEAAFKLKNVRDGIKLANVWLKQRELGGFESELVFYCFAYLSAKKKINHYMSSYQAVRMFWTFLCETDWHEGPPSLNEDVKEETLALYKRNYELTFLDHSGYHNVAAFLNTEVYLRAKAQARLALTLLDGNKFDSFQSLFITRVPFGLQCDAILKLKNSENFDSIYKTLDKSKKWKFYGFYKQLIANEITDVLKQGLTRRASSITLHIPSDDNVLRSGLDLLTFGLTLDPAHAFNVIEKGPHDDDDPKSQEFRAFWRGLSELRRFEDGTVREAVYFRAETIARRRKIFTKVLHFVFNKFESVEVQVVCDEVERQIKETYKEELCLKIKEAYDDLGKKLRELKLPLAITGMQGTSDSFSYTECRPPEPTRNFDATGTQLYKERYGIFPTTRDGQIMLKALPKYVAPLELVIQLGMSSKWPNDLSTLQHMKTQFYFEISKLMSEGHGTLSVVKFDHVDLLHGGLVFRLRIFVAKEIQLAKRCVGGDGVVSYKDNEASLKLERQLEILPKVTGALHGIQMQYPSFGPSTAIIKRWVRSQLLDDSHVPDVVLNLLNASLFLNTGAFSAPNLPQVAFFRFLKFLAEVDWNLNAVVVNFNNDIDGASLNETEVGFQQNRRGYPPLFIITPYDAGRSVFTRRGPSREVLRRLSLLGAEAYKIVQASVMKSRKLSVQKLFVPNLRGYDLLIHLLEKSVSEHETTKKNKMGGEEAVFPVVGFDRVQIYLRNLRKTYGKFALFFHDTYKPDSTVIAILWKRNVPEVTDFKVHDCGGMRCVDNGKLELNRESLIHDFFVCGAGLVATIRKGS